VIDRLSIAPRSAWFSILGPSIDVVAASARNISTIVYRLLEAPDGLSVTALQEELGIADRTYRKYRAFLQYDFEPFRDADGNSRLIETGRGDERWLVLRPQQ
jgi:hypothetical protein